MAQITKAHHTGLQVRSLDRSLAFYRDVLGFEEVFRWNPQAPYIRELVGYPDADLHVAVLRMPGSDTFLELLEYRNVTREAVDTSTANPGTAHVAFFVDDLEALYRELDDRGVGFCVQAGHPDDRAEQRGASGLHDRPRRHPGRAHPIEQGLRRIRARRRRLLRSEPPSQAFDMQETQSYRCAALDFGKCLRKMHFASREGGGGCF